MTRTCLRVSGALIAVVCLLCGPAPGLINPDFTPIHLTGESRMILTVRTGAGEIGDSVALEVVQAVKGQAPARVTIDLSKAAKQHVEAARRQLAAGAGKPMLLFAGKYGQDERGYLHVQGVWMRLAGGAEGNWTYQGIDSDMSGTWAGGTDMLLRCVQYVLADEKAAFVPVTDGTAWRSVRKFGAVKGTVAGISVVDLSGDGRLCLHLASPDGDRVFRAVEGKEEFEDITAKAGLSARSALSAWGDFDGDGRVDLASWDPKALTVWRQTGEGTFSPVKADVNPAECSGLATVGLVKGARAALVASGTSPALLTPAEQGLFQAAPLPAPKDKVDQFGKPQSAVVADFTGDGIPDVLQPFEKGSLLYVGTKDGGFEPPKSCGVRCTAGGGRAVVGDFDADGWLDVFVAGCEGVLVFQNLHDGSFQEAMGLSGEIAYKSQPFATWCGVGDFNNDSRQDLFITYQANPPLLYFNRGFRSFGEAPKLEIALGEPEGMQEELPKGQQAAALADFDRDGAEDLVIALSGGELWCAYNDLGGSEARCIRVRLPVKGAPAFFATVTAWEAKRCLGARVVAAGGPPAMFGVREAGTYLLKWRLPGREWQERKVTVEDRPAEVLLEGPAGIPGQAK